MHIPVKDPIVVTTRMLSLLRLKVIFKLGEVCIHGVSCVEQAARHLSKHVRREGNKSGPKPNLK